MEIFKRKFRLGAEAEVFSERVGGVLITPDTVEFEASYTMSKASYSVKKDMYKVYINMRCKNGARHTVIVYRKTSKEAYYAARVELVKLKKGEL